MHASPVCDHERLRAVQGRFRDSPSWRFASRCFAVVLLVLAPIPLITLIQSRGLPVWPLRPVEWILIISAVGCLAAAIILWKAMDREYDFTGEEILERRCGIVRWRLPVSAITRVHLERVKGGMWAHLYSGSQRYSVFLVSELRKQLLSNET